MRHVPPGSVWHPATDNLAGGAAYGVYSGDSLAPAFSVRFTASKSTTLLFMTGSKTSFIVASYGDVLNSTLSTSALLALRNYSSTIQNGLYMNRNLNFPEEPIVALS